MEGKKFTLKPLPYAYDSLEPFIDERTVTIHHDKHQQTYVDNLNKALSKHPELFNMSLDDILKNIELIPCDIKQAVINNAGGVYNHEFYFDGIGPNKGGEPEGALKEAISNTFGSYENFKAKLKEAALGQFGSGWGWLVLNKDNKLEIISTANQNNPLSNRQTPLLTVDVWEHAYYLKYQNRRADYLDGFFELINWDVVSDRFKKATNL
ncbi:superoxide dismutase [Eubacterium multiforme]|uniref:Superoxide dismutase n=1 Tax=Eubacterium multiforme TaxID=83339 RepID=A0ABT9UWF6_9FIRM|nr:superoxide dismutase [Eubacterium multiforme]MDQ0150653.1 Fe-Mn family superoxide dismutase [Eubacterium multiforme]